MSAQLWALEGGQQLYLGTGYHLVCPIEAQHQEVFI